VTGPSNEGIKVDALEAVSGLNMTAARLSPDAISESSSKPLASQRGFVGGEAGDVPARAVEPRDDASCDRVARVSRWRAAVAVTPCVRIMSGCRPTNSAASARIRLNG
jgi:hypothetical protein